MWEPPGERGRRRRRATGPVVLVAPSTAQDPEHRLLRAALAGLAGEPVRVIATWNGREPSPPVTVPAQRGARAVAVLLAHDAGVRPRGRPRRPRDADARARLRLPGGRLARGRRHGRERRPGGLGRARRAAAAALVHAARGAARGAARARPAASMRAARAARRRLDRRRTTAARGPPRRSRRWVTPRNALTSSSRCSTAAWTVFVARVEELRLAARPGAGSLAVDEDHRHAVAAEVVAAVDHVRVGEAVAPVGRVAHLQAIPLGQQVDGALERLGLLERLARPRPGSA